MPSKFIIFLPLLAALLFPLPALADVNLGAQFWLQRDQTVADTFPSITDIISKSLLPNALLLAGIILLFILVGGGFTVISSAGNPDKTQKGSQAITGAIIGFVVIFAAYWIIQIIEVITGVKILNPSIT